MVTETIQNMEAEVLAGSKRGLKAKPVISIWLDDRGKSLNRKKHPEYSDSKTDIHPVKLRATFQEVQGGVKKYPPVNYLLYYENGRKVVSDATDFAVASDRTKTPRTERQKAIRKALTAAEAKADQVLESSDVINRDTFDFLYSTAGNLQTVKAVFDLVVAKQPVKGTRDIYSDARNKIFSYAPNLTWGEVTVDWVKKMLSEIRHARTGEELSQTTKNIYLRTLKLAFKEAIRLKLVHADAYPFGAGKIQIKETEAHHRPISVAEKNKLESAFWTDAPGARYPSAAKKTEARDFWLFSYYCNGLNMADIFDLKFKHILENEEIRKHRVKNINRNSNELSILIDLPEVQAIIKKYGLKYVGTPPPDAYVFPIYEGSTSDEDRDRLKHNKTANINKWLKKIGKELGIKQKLTTYTARHSFGSIMYAEGVPVAEIKEAFGHKEEKMTQTYLNGMPLKIKKQRQQLLRNLGKAS